MNILSVSGLSKAYGGRVLFDGVSFSIEDGEKVGFIGVNGSGKSTLFRMVAGLESPDAGDIAIRRGARVRHLAQEPEFTPGIRVLDAAAEGRPELQAALHEYHVLGHRLAEPHEDHERLLARHAEAGAAVERLGGWDWSHRAEAMLTRLGVTDWDRTVDDLSGGEAKRVALARALLAEPELLLLDEPTNHLDADTVLFLEEFLIDFAGAVMLVTHDRYFLDRVVDRMLEVSVGELTSYPGGYTEYLIAQQERSERQATLDARRRRLIEKELDWAKRSPPARTGKQRARLHRIDSLEKESRAFRGKRAGTLSLPEPEPVRLGRTVLDLEGISKSFGDNTLIRDFTARLQAGERIGVIGPNGAGKTTLVRIILGEEPADAGEVVTGVNTRIAYFDQLREQLDPEKSVYDAAGGTDWVEIGGRRQHLRSYLEGFLFPTARQEQMVGSLSGGERNRLLLAKLFMQPSNLLILDEPTNDLDLVTLQVLEEALVDYPGCVLMVTHDRFFLDKIATALFVFEGDGVVHRHEGGFERYRVLREAREAEKAEVARAAREAKPKPAPAKDRPKKALTWKEERELEGMEARILEAESARDVLGEALADPDLYQDADRAARITEDFRAAERDVETLYARWQELEAKAAG